MTTFVEYLRLFNRKERFYLVGWALGNQTFQLGDESRRSLGEETGLEIPRDAFVAMDYHLNWIHAAIHLLACRCGKDVHDNPSALVAGKSTQMIEGNQEDIDLVVAYSSNGTQRFIAIEAKGDSPWKQQQLDRKVHRLDNTLRVSANVSTDPYFVLASPERPANIVATVWPAGRKAETRSAGLRCLGQPISRRSIVATTSEGSRKGLSTGGCRID